MTRPGPGEPTIRGILGDAPHATREAVETGTPVRRHPEELSGLHPCRSIGRRDVRLYDDGHAFGEPEIGQRLQGPVREPNTGGR